MSNRPQFQFKLIAFEDFTVSKHTQVCCFYGDVWHMTITEELSSMPTFHCVAFAASCCERMVTSYDAFCRAEKWGKPEFLRATLDEVWLGLESSSFSAVKTQLVIKTLLKEDVIPDPGDFRSVFSDSAGDAANGILRLIQYINKPDIKHILLIAQFSVENVVAYLDRVCCPISQAPIDPGIQEWLDQAPLKKAEVEKQQQDVALLKLQSELKPEFVKQLCWSSRNMGIQPLKRGLLRQQV